LEWKKKYLQDMKGLIEQRNDMKEVQKETQRELGELKRRHFSSLNSIMKSW
jgi:hypothetical protein